MASNAQKKATKTDLIQQAIAAKTGTGSVSSTAGKATSGSGSTGSSSSSQEQAKKNAATVAGLVNARMATAGAQVASSNNNAAARAAVQTQRAQEEAQRKATAQKAREAMADFNKSFGEYAKNAATYHTGMALTSAAKAAANGMVGLTDDGKTSFKQRLQTYDFDTLQELYNDKHMNEAEKAAIERQMLKTGNQQQLQGMADGFSKQAAAIENMDTSGLDNEQASGIVRKMADYQSKAKEFGNSAFKAGQRESYASLEKQPDYDAGSAMVINRQYNNQYKTLMGLVAPEDYQAGAMNAPDEWAKANDAYVYGKYLSLDEKKKYSYIYNTAGEEAAGEYLDWLVRDSVADRRSADVTMNGVKLFDNLSISQETMTRLEELADIDRNSPEYQAMSNGEKAKKLAATWFIRSGAAKVLNEELDKAEKVLKTGVSVGTNLLSGLGAIDAAVQKLIYPDKDVIYGGVAMDFAAATKGLRQGAQEGMGKGGRFAYGLVTSMLDSTAVAGLAMLGLPFTGTLLGGSAASSKMLEMHQQGYSDSQVITVGLLNGVAEALFEEVSIEKLISTPTGRTAMEKAIETLIQGGVEASEETATGLANAIVDFIVLGDKSEYNLKKQEYMLEGMTATEASRRAAVDWVTQLGMETLAGFLSGGFMQGARQAYGSIGQVSITNVPNQVLMQTTATVAQNENASDYLHRLSEDIAGKLWAGYSVKSNQDAMDYLNESGRIISRKECAEFLQAVDKEMPGYIDEVLPQMWTAYQQRRAEMTGETIARKEAEQAAADLGVEESINAETDTVNAETDAVNAETDNINEKADTVKPEIDTKIETEAKPQVRTENKVETGEKAKTEQKRWTRPEVKAQEQTKNSWMSLAENAVAYDDTAAQQNLEQAIAAADSERIQAVLDSMNGQDYYGLAELLTEELDRRSRQETAAEAKTEAQPATVQQAEVQQTEAQQTVENKEDETNGRTDTRAEGTQRETAAAAERGTGTGDQTDSGGRNAYNIGSSQQSKVRSRLHQAANLSGRVLSDVAGIKTDLPVKVMSEQAVAEDQELRQIRQDAAVRGIQVEFTLGAIQQNGLRANGLSTAIQQNGQTRRCIVINAVNMFETAQQLYDHEYIHDRMSKDPALRQVVCDYIATLDGFAEVAEVYAAKYGPAIEGMSTREAAAYVAEEMLCDAYAGYNRFNSGVTDMMTELRAIADGALGERQQGQQQTDQYSEIKNAVREVLAEAGIVQNQAAQTETAAETADTGPGDTSMAVAEEGNGQRQSTEAAYEEAKEKFTVKNYSTDWHSGQLDMVMVAKDKNGNTAGTIEYAVYDGKPYIQMIRTEDGYKRQGVARYLLQNLQMEYPNTAIDFGMTTQDGTALLDSVTHEETSTDEKARLDLYNENNARMAEIENELNRAYELEDSGRNLSEEEQALVDSIDELGKEWDDLNEWLYEHREDAKLEPTKRFVTTPETARTEQETRFAVSDSENAEYMQAVEDGDQEKQRSILDEVAKAAGYPVRAYHGTQRGDRVGTVFRKDRATSGPMAYFTDDRSIAENYSRDKRDTSFGNDERLNSDEGYFRVTDTEGNDINIIEAFNKLSPVVKRRLADSALRVTLDDDWENVVYDQNNKRGLGDLDYKMKAAKGNAAEALVKEWITDGNIMGQERLFLDVLEKSGITAALQKAGMSAPTYIDTDYREEKVYDVYLGINNPFVTGESVTEDFVRGFEEWVSEQDIGRYGEINQNLYSDQYSKGNYTPEQYAARMRENIQDGNTNAWTTVPDFMTDYLKELGYDGIQDTGGKGGGQVHTVWIPFEQNQVKSADLVTYDDDGNVIPLSERFNDQKDDIRWAVADDMEEARQKAHEAFEGGDNEALRQFMYETNADPANRSETDIRQNRKMGLFSQEYSQLQPFVRTMAKLFQQDVYESQKGQVLQGEHNAWFAERQTTKPIANLLDRWGLSWQQVQDTIDAMAENDWSGVKNTKAFKAAEVEIDHALRHGYNRIGGQYQSPIQQYVSMANQAITGYATAEEFLQAQNMNSMARDAERQLEDPNNPYRERALPEDTMPDSYNQGRADTAADYASQIEEEKRNNRADRYAPNAQTTAMEAVDEYQAPNDIDRYLDELTRQANEDEDATREVEADEWFPEDIGRDEERNAIYMEQLMEQEAWEQEQENSYLENALNQTNPDDFTPAFDEEGRMASLLADETAEADALADAMAARAEEVDLAIAAEIQKRRMLEAVGMDMDENLLPDGLLTPEEEQEWIERARMQKAVETANAKMENGDDLTLDEWEAVQRQMADEARNKAIDIIDRTNFTGGEAMQNLGVRISGSFADYNSIQEVLKGIQANQRMEKALEKQLRKLEKKADPAEWKQATYFADAVVEGTVDIRNLPRGVDADLLEKVVELKTAIKACRTDYLDIKKTAISRRNRLLAEEVLSGQKDRKVGLFTLNLLQPERVAAAIYGGKAGERVYQTYFQTVRQNEGEKLRFIERQMDAIREVTDSTGKKRIGNVAESMLIQMAMESKSLQDTMEKLEQKERDLIETEANLYRQTGKFSWQQAEESQEFTNATMPGETAEQEAQRRADEGRTLTGEQQDLAIRMAGMQTMMEALEKGEMKVEGRTFKVDRVLVENTANKMRELYKQYYEATNEFLVAHGEEPIGFVQDYAPHMQPDRTKLGMEKLLELVGMPGEIGELNASIAGLTHTWKPNKKWNPFFLHRAHGQTIDYDAYTGFEQYVMHLGEVMYHMDDIMRLRKGVTFLREDYMDQDAYTEVQAIKDIRNEDYFGKLSWLATRGVIKPYEQLTAGQIDRAIDDYEELISKGNGEKEGNSAPFVMWMDNYANTLAGKQSALDRGREATMDRGRYPSQKGLDRIINTQTLNTVMNKVLGSNVVASMSSMMNQTSQIADLHAEIKKKHIAAAMRDMVTRRKDMELFRMNNDFLMERKGLGKLNSSMSAKIDEVLSAPARTMDGMLAQIIARSAYYQGLEMGMTERQADEYASNMGEKIQASRAKGSKAAIFDSKNVLTRMLTAFQVEALNTFEHRIYDMPRAFQRMADEKGIAVAARELAKYLAALLMTAFCWNRVCEEIYGSTPVVGDMLGLAGQFVANGYGYTLNDGMRHIINNVLGTNLDDGGEYDALRQANFGGEWSFDAAMRGTRYNALRQVPFLGNVLGFVGYNSDYASQADTTILASSVQGMNDEWKALRGSFPTEDENGNRLPMMERLRQGDIAGAIEAAFGLLTYTGAVKGVGRQARKTEQGLRMVAEGGKYSSNGNLQYAVDNENPLTWLQAGLFGRSATQSAQRYYAATGTGSTYSASPNQTAVYEMLTKDGMDERDAYERVMENAISKSELTTIQNMVSTGTSAEEALRMVEGQRKQKEEKAAAEDKETKTDKLVKAGLNYEDAYRIEWELGDITGEKVEKDGELKTVTGSEAKNKAAYCMEQGLNDQQFEALGIASDSCKAKYEGVKGQISLAEFTWAYGVNGGLSGKKEEKRAELQRILSGQLSGSKVSAVLKALGY